MCTRDESRDVLDAVFPLAEDEHHFHIFATPERRVADGPTFHGWALGARLGPKAAGTWGSHAEGAVQPTLPPALREVNYRELSRSELSRSRFWKRPTEVGLSCPTNADASLGWTVYCYQIWDVLFPQCQGDQSVLLILEGCCSRGSDAPRQSTARRAKCGYCPCCSRITHVIAPASFATSKPDRRKLNRVGQWQQFGPMAWGE